MNNEYKIKKYKWKLNNTNDLAKKNEYMRKIKYYDMNGGIQFENFMNIIRQFGLYTPAKFMNYYYLQFKSKKEINPDEATKEYFKKLFDELTMLSESVFSENIDESVDKNQKDTIILQRKLQWFKTYKPFLFKKIEEHDLDYILEDKTVNNSVKTEFLVEFINDCANLTQINFGRNFYLPIFNPQNPPNINYVTNVNITHLTFGYYYDEPTTIPNNVTHVTFGFYYNRKTTIPK